MTVDMRSVHPDVDEANWLIVLAASAGGIVIVQDPATAQYAGMPSSALTTGVVDRVLPLEAIAPALVEIVGTAAASGERAM